MAASAESLNPSQRRQSTPWLAAAFLFSGAAALMLEVVWNRKLHLLFGGSAVATSAVLAAYMGGLALGSLKVAPWMRRRFHPALAYGVMELGVGAYALLVPFLVELAGTILQTLPGQGSQFWGATFRFLLSGAVLIIPTSLMGATLPCLADLANTNARSEDDEDGAGSVGILYAANTLGAVVGTLLATFVLFPSLGVAGTNLLAAGVDVVVALGVLTSWTAQGRPGPFKSGSAANQSFTPGGVLRLPLWAYGVSGGVAMALEVLWSRSLSMVLGSSVHAFSLMLASFLLGLAVGARWASSPSASRGDPSRLLGLVLGATGVAAFVGTLLIDQLPGVIFEVARLPGLNVYAMWAAMLVCSGAVMFPAAVGFGAVLPVALRAAMPLGSTMPMGELVGHAYAINTAGAIAGATLAGLVLPPLLGVDHAAQALCVVLLGVAAWVVAGRARLAAGLCLAAALMGTWQGYDVAAWTAGAFRVYLARSVWGDKVPHGNVVFRRDGLSTTITVEEHSGRVSLKVNGKVDASSEGDMPTQVLSGLLPILLHPNPEAGAIIGFGSGVTSDATLSYGPLKRLEMVELEPAVVEAGQIFSAVNHSPWEDPRYVGIFDDGRNHLSSSGVPLDFIISEPSNPWITGASNLFTQEFWSVARNRLKQGGVFLQWVQLYELSSDRIKSLMGTFHNVFPHVLVFAANPESNDTLMIGSSSPLVLDEALLRKRWADPDVQRNLRRADLRSPLDVTALLLMDTKELEHFTAGYTRNTDNNMYVELNAPRDLIAFSQKEPELPFMRPLSGKRAPLLERNTRFVDTWENGALQLAMADVMFRSGFMDDARGYLAQLVGSGEPLESARTRILEAMDVLVGDEELAVVDADTVRGGDAAYIKVLRAMIDDNDARALEIFDSYQDLEKRSKAHRMLHAYLLYRHNWRWRASEAMEPLLQDLPYRRANLEVLFYGARMCWLADENQRAARLAYEFVDLRRAQRANAVQNLFEGEALRVNVTPGGAK